MAVSVALLLVQLVPASADVVVSGKLGPSVIDDNIIIERGRKTILNGTVINGNVTVRPGGYLVANGATIDGDILADVDTRIELRSRTKVDGDFVGVGARQLLTSGGTNITGTVECRSADNSRKTRALIVSETTISGDVKASKNLGRLNVKSSRVGGDILLRENLDGQSHILSNRVQGDVRATNNRGKLSISGNRIAGDLQVRGNDQKPVVGKNRIEGSTIID